MLYHLSNRRNRVIVYSRDVLPPANISFTSAEFVYHFPNILEYWLEMVEGLGHSVGMCWGWDQPEHMTLVTKTQQDGLLRPEPAGSVWLQLPWSHPSEEAAVFVCKSCSVCLSASLSTCQILSI